MSTAIGRRGRVLRRAHARAQRRFHAMFDAHVWHDPAARQTRLYVEAERLVEALLTEPHPTPLPVVIAALSWPRAAADTTTPQLFTYQAEGR